MKMGDSQFVIDTSGHCFMCLEKVKRGSETADKVKSTQTGPILLISFQNICSYLNTDLREVFGDSATFQGLEKSELQGTLCKECAQLYEVFSKKYLELGGNEEIQIKLETSLKIIYERMVATVDKDDGELWRNFKKEMLKRPYTKFQYGIVERLRRKMMEQCALLFRDKSSSDNAIGRQLPVPEKLPDECQTEIKLECVAAIGTSQVYTDRDQEWQRKLSKPTQQASQVPTNINLEIGEVKLTVSDNFMTFPEDDEDNESGDPCEGIDFVENSDEVLVKTETLTDDVIIIEGNAGTTPDNNSNSSVAIASSSGVSKTIGRSSLKEMWTLNPETGKHQCKDCSREFATFPTFYFHYRSEHLKIKYKCSKCDKGFVQSGSYTRHKKNCPKDDSTTVQFQCHICNKLFPLESNLSDHWKASPCEMTRGRGIVQKYPPTLVIKRPVKTPARIGTPSTINPQTGKLKCCLCPREFPHKWSAKHHYYSHHLNVSYHCTLCDQGFIFLDHYRQHHETVHMKVRFKCQKCGERFSAKSCLKTHLRNSTCNMTINKVK